MTRRRPGARPAAPSAPAPKEASAGIWYAAMIGAVLLIATGLYAAILKREVAAWRQAVDQLEIGQEFLRADRDEILEKARASDVQLSTLEAALEQDRARLSGLEDQRSRLQGDVLRLTETLAANEQRAGAAATDTDQAAALRRLGRERARLERELAKRQGDIARFETELADQADILQNDKALIEAARADKARLEAAQAAAALDRQRLEQQLAWRRQRDRRRQIVRGHGASLGEVQPYLAEVGPEDWRVIESWLAQQLQRPMAVPDLSAHGWSYEGARLLGANDGPPMAMLLYADAEGHPVSLTIARDGGGERPLSTIRDGELDLLSWQEERHAFFLAGDIGEDALQAVAIELQNRPPMLNEGAPVPVSRYVRPRFRPET